LGVIRASTLSFPPFTRHPDSLKSLSGKGAGRDARWAFRIALLAAAVALPAV
jgi:hypothetical protein